MNNKKYIIITLGILLCLGLVAAGSGNGWAWYSWGETSSLEEEAINIILEDTEYVELDVNISEIYCDGIECYADVSQKDIINTQWRRSVNYCSEYSECKEDDAECVVECLEYTDYTESENQNAIHDFIDDRLEKYSEAKTIRNQRQEEERQQSGKGKLQNI